jgi:hypothetical protein
MPTCDAFVKRARQCLRVWLCVLAGLGFGARGAGADPLPSEAAAEARRDVLLDQIARGVDLPASIREFAALAKAWQQRRDAEQAAKEAHQSYLDSVDRQFDERCTVAADPKVPLADWGLHLDWGRVVRVHSVKRVPSSALDEESTLAVYEVAGVARRYFIEPRRFSLDRSKPLDAKLGEWLVLCHGTQMLTDAALPAGWQKKIEGDGFAVRASQAPKVSLVQRWKPIHIRGSAYVEAIRNVKWRYPPATHALSNLQLGRHLGQGSWDVPLTDELSMILEVPSSVSPRNALAEGHHFWFVLGQPRFDLKRKKLVLVVRDVEARFFDEQP